MVYLCDGDVLPPTLSITFYVKWEPNFVDWLGHMYHFPCLKPKIVQTVWTNSEILDWSNGISSWKHQFLITWNPRNKLNDIPKCCINLFFFLGENGNFWHSGHVRTDGPTFPGITKGYGRRATRRQGSVEGSVWQHPWRLSDWQHSDKGVGEGRCFLCLTACFCSNNIGSIKHDLVVYVAGWAVQYSVYIGIWAHPAPQSQKELAEMKMVNPLQEFAYASREKNTPPCLLTRCIPLTVMPMAPNKKTNTWNNNSYRLDTFLLKGYGVCSTQYGFPNHCNSLKP